MIRGNWIKGGSKGAVAYYTQHLSSGDYYTQEETEETQSQWVGQGAEMLGLQGAVDKENFQLLAENLRPDNGEKLTVRNGGDRTFWDVTISPPKEYSILAMMGDEKTRQELRNLHREAVQISAQEIEANVGRRVRKNGANETTKTGNAIIALVEHETARPVDGVADPHLHTHMLFANATYDAKENQFFALDNSEAIPAMHMARQAYYSHLVQGLEKRGFKTETRVDKQDFKIVGFNQEITDSFSRRHEEVKKLSSEKMEKFGMEHQASSDKISAQQSREKKLDETIEERQEKWEAHIGKSQVQELQAFSSIATSGDLKASESHKHTDLASSIGHAKNTAFEHKSVLSQVELEREILKSGRGQFTLQEMREHLTNDASIISHGSELTTNQVIKEEKAVLAMINNGKDLHEPHAKQNYESAVGPQNEDWQYSKEQKQAIDGVLKNRDFAVCVNGVAGAGKTSMLKEIEKGINENQQTVTTLAPSNAAKNVLKEEGFESAQTIQQWIANPSLRKETRGHSLVIDEAGMLSSRDMVNLTKKAKQNDNRLIFVGDVKQLSSVQRGDGMRLIQDKTTAQTFTIEESNRQKKEEYSDVVKDIRKASNGYQWETAFSKMEQANIIKEVSAQDNQGNDMSREALIDKVATQKASDPNRLVVASNWETIHAVNSSVRSKLKEQGELGKEDKQVNTLQNRNLKQGELAKAKFYEKGDIVEITRSVDKFKKGQTFKVEQSRGNGKMLEAIDKDGQTVKIPQGKLAKEQAIQAYKERRIEVSKGDKLLIQGNHSKELVNGSKVSVSKVSHEGLKVVDSKGKVHELPQEFNKYSHAYATTAHASQGQTVDKVSVIADGMDKKSLYVGASRGRQECEVLTTNQTNLKANLTNNSEKRKLAVELVDEKSKQTYKEKQQTQEQVKKQKEPSLRERLQAQKEAKNKQQIKTQNKQEPQEKAQQQSNPSLRERLQAQKEAKNKQEPQKQDQAKQIAKEQAIERAKELARKQEEAQRNSQSRGL